LNNTKQKLQSGQVVIGAQFSIPEPALVELSAYAGFDFVFVDAEHGAIGTRSLVDMIRAAEIHDLTSIVRVSRNAPHTILQVLDMGAQGIIVPGVTTKEDAQRAVRSAKYDPLGMRGAGGGRARGYGHLMPVNEYASKANAQTLVVALLEDVQVLDNLDSILSVEGIDAFIVGPNDLSQSMGLLGQLDHPEFLRVQDEIIDRVLTAGRVMGSRIGSVEQAETKVDRGFLWLHANLGDIIVRTGESLVRGVRSLD
jgi:4-hydroxy-2-oxoheptanedioate aldolase